MYAAVDPAVTRRAGFELRTTSATRVAVWSAPLLQAIGATVAVARCRRE